VIAIGSVFVYTNIINQPRFRLNGEPYALQNGSQMHLAMTVENYGYKDGWVEVHFKVSNIWDTRETSQVVFVTAQSTASVTANVDVNYNQDYLITAWI
jgi:hypothetical protein